MTSSFVVDAGGGTPVEDVLTDNLDRPGSSAIREVVYDEHGQTWDVYGADFDAEILGQAIQMHLENMIKRRIEGVGEGGGGLQSQAGLGGGGGGTSEDMSDDCVPYDREGSTTDRALGFVLRYLCSVTRSKGATTS